MCDEPSLFDPHTHPRVSRSTSSLAAEAAGRSVSSRRHRIMQLLAEAPAAIWQIAARLDVHDHQISGRFSELSRDGLIEVTGERRIKPETGCWAEVYRLAVPGALR